MANPSGQTSTPHRVERVTSCSNCPFYDFDDEKCSGGERVMHVGSYYRDDDPPPEVCPLRSGPVLVVLTTEALLK